MDIVEDHPEFGRLVAIDPGTTKSAMVYFALGKPIRMWTLSNEQILDYLRTCPTRSKIRSTLVVEMIASYGMPVGREVFETCLWIGRYVEAWQGDWALVYRTDVKAHLCHSVRAKDANVSQALRDRFGEKGTKKAPGVLYGIKGDEWAALAVAVTYWDTKLCKAEEAAHGTIIGTQLGNADPHEGRGDQARMEARSATGRNAL